MMDVWVIVFRTLFFYFFILIVYRLMGKREVGQLGVIDLIVSILMAELIAISIDNPNDSVMNAVIPLLLLLIFQVSFAFLSLKSSGFRTLMDGKPSVIINDGKIQLKEMIKQRYNLDDLLTQLRDKNVRNIGEVEHAILESSGKLSVFTYEKSNRDYPMPIIVDGKIVKDTLKYLNKEPRWVHYMLVKENVELDNVFYAFYTRDKLFVIKDSDLEMRKI